MTPRGYIASPYSPCFRRSACLFLLKQGDPSSFLRGNEEGSRFAPRGAEPSGLLQDQGGEEIQGDRLVLAVEAGRDRDVRLLPDGRCLDREGDMVTSCRNEDDLRDAHHLRIAADQLDRPTALGHDLVHVDGPDGGP